MKFFFSLIFLSSCLNLFSQFSFQYENSIPLTINGETLSRAWEGGINSVQFQKMDLNGDGVDDLIVYHRMSGEITTYLAENNTYVWAPEYKSIFPAEINHWLILADYNCDGKMDIFTSVPQGITVFKNISTGNLPEWEQATDFLRFDAGANIQVNASDIPGIVDVDGDGDLDILSYRFTTASTIDFYKNTSMENNNNCDELTFTRVTRKWGEFAECECDSFAFSGDPCNAGGAANTSFSLNDPAYVEHAGGKTILLFDADGDGDMDLITSDEFCQTLYFMENVGDAQNALMTSFSSYPAPNPAAFQIFPNAFLEDINFDGHKDLLVSSNAAGNILNSVDFTNTAKVYTNLGTNLQPNFTGTSVPFLQNEMLDLGENTYPAFVDFDGDGDFDLFVGNRGQITPNGFSGSIFLFENTGGKFSPAFELKDNDFLDLKSQNLRNIKIQFADINDNGQQDLIYQSTTANNETKLQYRLNQGDFSFGDTKEIAITIGENDNAYFYDINKNGKLDLLLATRFGAVHLYVNKGNFIFETAIENYAGITANFKALNPNLFIADLDNDGNPELVKTDLSGQISILSGSINTEFIPSSVAKNILKSDLYPNQRSTAIGKASWMTTADLFGDGKPAIFIGNNRGGISILKNESIAENGSESNAIQLTLFPNPTAGSFYIRTDANAMAEMYSLKGEMIFSSLRITGGVSKEINTTQLAAGVYLVKVSNGANKPTVQRILIQK
ncbi:FG-GAP-like repeat-containing protein [Roseivirga echinicomitans]